MSVPSNNEILFLTFSKEFDKITNTCYKSYSNLLNHYYHLLVIIRDTKLIGKRDIPKVNKLLNKIDYILVNDTYESKYVKKVQKKIDKYLERAY